MARDQRKNKGTAPAQTQDMTLLKREAERLRAELMIERKRVEALKNANGLVSRRLSAAIESVKSILARQG